MNPSPALLVVIYPVIRGSETRFQEWLQQLDLLASKAEGFLGFGLDRGSSNAKSGEWKITYKFQTDSLRDAWADSVERAQAHEAVDALLVSDRHESRISEGGQTRVMMVVTARVANSRLEEWNTVQQEFNSAVSKFRGFDSLDVFKEQTSDQATTIYTIVQSFDSEENMQLWRDSSERREILKRAQGLSEDEEVRIQPGAFGQWFSTGSTPSAHPPTWKQAMVTLLMLYPLCTIYDMTLGHVAGAGLNLGGRQIITGLGIPFPAGVWLGNLFGTIVLTWMVMPFITKVFSWWLNPFASKTETVRGFVLIVVLYLLEILVATFIFKTWGI